MTERVYILESLRRGVLRRFGQFATHDLACEFACWLLDLGYKEVVVKVLVKVLE